MSDISFRQSAILQHMCFGSVYTPSDLVARFTTDTPSPATLRRDLTALIHAGYLRKQGTTRSTAYTKTMLGALNTPLDAHAYFANPDASRTALTQYQFAFLNELPNSLFDANTLAHLDEATTLYHRRGAESATGVRKRELERLVIELSWKSSAIEGNTYTLLDTERLLVEGVEPPGHSKEEATMIRNHKRAFAYLQTLSPETPVSVHLVEDLHAILTEHLGVVRGLRRGEVGVVGAVYRPLSVPTQLHEQLVALISRIHNLTDPYSQALLALVGTSYLQPFEDGNKRTARLFANALLMRAGRAPLSYRTVEVVRYRESMLAFYEQLTLVPMRNIFTEQYRFACEHYLGTEDQ